MRLPASAPARIVVLASGAGTLLQSLIDAARADEYPASIVAVGTDRPCQAQERAESAGVANFLLQLSDFADRGDWDRSLADACSRHRPDLVVTAGFMKLLGPNFLDRFGGRIINSHPALLPAFPGAHAVPDALAYGVRITGATVHLVDDGVDTGPILMQEPVPVLPEDDVDSLHERIKVVERRLLADVIAAVACNGVVSDGRKARISSE